MTDALICNSLPDDFARLAWNVFFASRGRGITPHVHFPWWNDGLSIFVGVQSSREIVAGLVLRNGSRRASGSFAPDDTGLVGLVCVRPDMRGRGYSRVILTEAIAEARRLRLGRLVLWTSQHDVYRSLGFVVRDESLFGWAASASPLSLESVARTPWPDAGSSRGLPPFATDGWRAFSSDAWVLAVEDGAGPILCEWGGDDDAVAALLLGTMPPRWRMNALVADRLPATLRRAGCTLELRRGNLQMVLSLGRETESDCLNGAATVRVLDRV